jgi:hypothetical protein
MACECCSRSKVSSSLVYNKLPWFYGWWSFIPRRTRKTAYALETVMSHDLRGGCYYPLKTFTINHYEDIHWLQFFRTCNWSSYPDRKRLLINILLERMIYAYEVESLLPCRNDFTTFVLALYIVTMWIWQDVLYWKYLLCSLLVFTLSIYVFEARDDFSWIKQPVVATFLR